MSVEQKWHVGFPCDHKHSSHVTTRTRGIKAVHLRINRSAEKVTGVISGEEKFSNSNKQEEIEIGGGPTSDQPKCRESNRSYKWRREIQVTSKKKLKLEKIILKGK